MTLDIAWFPNHMVPSILQLLDLQDEGLHVRHGEMYHMAFTDHDRVF